MPGVHKNNTISFRPDKWERVMIEERAYLSGMHKKDFITRSCIYSNICVVGNEENIQRIVNSVEEMRNVMQEIADRLSVGNFPLTEDVFQEMSLQYKALCLSIVDILDGAAYLFNKEKSESSSVLDKEEQLRQLFETLNRECYDGDINSKGDI